MLNKKAILLIIDMQEDFCNPVIGSLYVPGADKDINRLSKMIQKHGNDIRSITKTLDSHHTVHIAHPIWWINSKGEHPAPYTPINLNDVEDGTWRSYNPAFQKWSLNYVNTLHDNKCYALTIWPYHCRIGTSGACVAPELEQELYAWESKFKVVNYVPKGSCIFTEHYSAVKADVEFMGFDSIPSDPTTQLNSGLINALKTGCDILLCGEALDFCLANTVRDIANEFSVDEVKKLVLLEDASSPVNAPGIEYLAKDFIDEMTGKGMRISTTDKYFR